MIDERQEAWLAGFVRIVVGLLVMICLAGLALGYGKLLSWLTS